MSFSELNFIYISNVCPYNVYIYKYKHISIIQYYCNTISELIFVFQILARKACQKETSSHYCLEKPRANCKKILRPFRHPLS